MQSDERIASLARRVRWLDRHRRTISVTIAVLGAVLGIVFVPELLGDEWPRFHARVTAIAAAVVLALVIDIALAGIAAAWEVQHDRLTRNLGTVLPRAVWRRKR